MTLLTLQRGVSEDETVEFLESHVDKEGNQITIEKFEALSPRKKFKDYYTEICEGELLVASGRHRGLTRYTSFRHRAVVLPIRPKKIWLPTTIHFEGSEPALWDLRDPTRLGAFGETIRWYLPKPETIEEGAVRGILEEMKKRAHVSQITVQNGRQPYTPRKRESKTYYGGLSQTLEYLCHWEPPQDLDDHEQAVDHGVIVNLQAYPLS